MRLVAGSTLFALALLSPFALAADMPMHTTTGPVAPKPDLFPKVPWCGHIPPDPSDKTFGSCEGAPHEDPKTKKHCAAHTHDKMEVGRCSNKKSVEVHIKCSFPGEDNGPHSDHSYGVTVVNVDCSGIDDTGGAAPAAGNGSVDIPAPGCTGTQTCCKGPLTSDDAQNHCDGLSVADRAKDPKCNNVFRLCGGDNSGATLTKEAKAAFCANLTRCTQPACTGELILQPDGTYKSDCLDYKLD